MRTVFEPVGFLFVCPVNGGYQTDVSRQNVHHVPFFGGILCTTRYLPKEGSKLVQRNYFIFLTPGPSPKPWHYQILIEVVSNRLVSLGR